MEQNPRVSLHRVNKESTGPRDTGLFWGPQSLVTPVLQEGPKGHLVGVEIPKGSSPHLSSVLVLMQTGNRSRDFTQMTRRQKF